MPRTVAYRAGGFTNYGISYTKFSQEELAERRDRAMTENEAIYCLKADSESHSEVCEECNLHGLVGCDHCQNDAIEVAIKALEEVQRYRAIGEISTCRSAVEICRAMIERGIEPENIEAYIAFEDKCVQNGFTIKGLLEAGEKQTAQKVKNSGERVPFEWYCPTCGSILCDDGYKDTEIAFCENCGQKLDWNRRANNETD